MKVGDHMVTMLKATVERRYRDSAGNWKSSGSFSRNEIPLAIYGLMKAFVGMVVGEGPSFFYRQRKPKEKQEELADWEEISRGKRRRRVREWGSEPDRLRPRS